MKAGRRGILTPTAGRAYRRPDIDKTQVIPAVTEVEGLGGVPPRVRPSRVGRSPGAVAIVRRRGPGIRRGRTRTAGGRAIRELPMTTSRWPTPSHQRRKSEPESDIVRLNRLLAFVVRQEPRLNWAVGDHVDGTTVLVTDLAHGWVPAGIKLPAGVRLLEPERRTGRASALIGDAIRAVTYSPGDSLGWSIDFAATKPSLQPRELPAVDDLGWQLSQATHWRDGVPRIVHTLAKAAAAATGVVDEEVDLLRVHLDTARYRLLDQYPDVDPALLLNCLLMAATEGIVTGDLISANYHFSWFQKLDAAT